MIIGTIPQRLMFPVASGRSKYAVVMNNSAAGGPNVTVGSSYSQVAGGDGVVISPGNSTTQLEITNELWAVASAAGALVSVVLQ